MIFGENDEITESDSASILHHLALANEETILRHAKGDQKRVGFSQHSSLVCEGYRREESQSKVPI